MVAMGELFRLTTWMLSGYRLAMARSSSTLTLPS